MNVNWRDTPPSLLGQLIGAVVGAIFGGATVYVIPWLMFADRPVHYGFVIPVLRAYAMLPFHAWALFVLVYATVVGFRLGIFGIFDLFNLIWTTGDTNDTHVRALAMRYRVLIPLTAAIAVGLAWLSRYL